MKYSVNLLILLLLTCFCFEHACAKSASERLFEITADRTERKEHGKILVAFGNAQGQVAGQGAKIEADTIAFDKKTRIVEATGHVRITRHNMVTRGSKFRFKINSRQYLVTQPGILVTVSKLMCRSD